MSFLNKVQCPVCDKPFGAQGIAPHLRYKHAIVKTKAGGYRKIRMTPGRPTLAERREMDLLMKKNAQETVPQPPAPPAETGTWVVTYEKEPPKESKPFVPDLSSKMNAAKEVFPGDSYLQTAYLLMREPLTAGNLRTAARCLDARADEIEQE